MTTPTEPTALYFVYQSSAPDLDRFDVKRVSQAELLGRTTTLTVIGESHCIGIHSLGFHELCSCKSLSAETVHRTPLDETVERSFSFENEQCSATTRVETRPLETPDEHTADVAYRFGPDAWTTVSVETDGYETYHTYPECNLTLYTRTRLRIEPADETDVHPPDRDATRNNHQRNAKRR